MKNLLYLCALLCALSQAQQLQAQCDDNRYEFLDVNQVNARFNNGPISFYDMYQRPAYEVPKGSGKHALFAAGLWVGGLDAQNELHLAANTYRQSGRDFYAGPYHKPVALPCEVNFETAGNILVRGLKKLSNGKVLAVTKTAIYVYNPASRQTQMVPLPSIRNWVDVLELPDGRIMIFGDNGYPNKLPVLYMDTLNYAIAGGPTLNYFQFESSANILPNGKVLIANALGAEELDPLTNLSLPVASMNFPRCKHAALSLANGDVFVAGGGSGVSGTGFTNRSQIFDANLQTWTAGPLMSASRQRAGAVTLQDGRIFILGGTGTSLRTDIYDPTTGLMVSGPDLPEIALDPNVIVLDAQHLLISSDPQGVNGALYQFNIVTGDVESFRYQNCHNRSVLLDSTTCLMAFNDFNQIFEIDLPSRNLRSTPWQAIWKVSRSEIDAFRADFMAGNVDFSQYPSIGTWPAEGDINLGEDRNLAPFVDVNLDGRYRPAIDGDYPCIVGDQALWWVYNDQGPHVESGGRQIGLQIETMAYAVDCQQTACPDTSIDYTIFMHLEVTNQSDTAYHDMRLGLFTDPDLGDATDDYIGTDTSLNMAYVYNSNDNDYTYGLHPPALATISLPNGQLPGLGGMIAYQNNFDSTLGNPILPIDYYNYLNQIWKDGTHLVDNGLDGYSGTAAGPPTNAMYTGTQGFCGGTFNDWTEVALANVPMDRRFLQSSPLFDLQPGESTTMDMAFVYARGTDNYNSVCQVKAASQIITNWWQNQLDRGCFSLVVHRDAPKPEGTFRIIPNPADNGVFQIALSEPLLEDGVLEVIDLNGRLMQSKIFVAGELRLPVDASNLAAGVYLLRLRTDAELQIKKLIIR